MKVRNIILVSLLFILTTFLLIACSNDTSSDSSNSNSTGSGKLAKEQVLNISNISEPPSLHPGKANDVASIIVLTQIFEGLTRLDPNGEPQEAMASNIDISEDGKKYTFTIRDGVTWTDGSPVTAEDFEYAWKWVLDPENAEARAAHQLFIIKNAEAVKKGEVPIDEVGFRAIDEKTFEVELEYAADYFLKLTANHVFSPMKKGINEEHPDWDLSAGEHYITNGPFYLAEWDQKNKIVFKKNQNYWDADTVKLETINMPIITDENTEFNMYQNGELDYAGHPTGKLPLAAIKSLKEEGVLNADPRTGTYYYTFNVEKEPFDNANIRKAFTYAIDRKAIVENITQAGEVPAMAYIAPSIWEENLEGYFADNDVEKAKEFLEKGLKEKGLSSVEELPPITLSYNTSEEHAQIAQAIQDMWKKNLGVEVTLENNEWQVYLDMLSAGDYQVGRIGYSASVADAYTLLQTYLQVSGSNYPRWLNDEFSDLLRQSTQETDPVKRKEILRKAEEIFIDEMPVLPIYYYSNVYVHRDYVKDINVTSLGYIQFKWTYIEEH